MNNVINPAIAIMIGSTFAWILMQSLTSTYPAITTPIDISKKSNVWLCALLVVNPKASIPGKIVQ